MCDVPTLRRYLVGSERAYWRISVPLCTGIYATYFRLAVPKVSYGLGTNDCELCDVRAEIDR